MEEETSIYVRKHTLERLINILQSDDRSAKKSAFIEIKNILKNISGVELRELYEKLTNVLRICFHDKTESCREQALLISYEFIKRLDVDKSYLTYLIPVIHGRICHIEDYEHSEELRYLYVQFLALLIDKYERSIAPYAGDIVDILSILIADEAPHVKKSSCACIIKLANTIPYEFYLNTKKCIKPIANNLLHQHWRVRVAAIEALELTLLKGDNKCVPDVVNPLSRCLLDDSPFVRLAITKLTGHWLIDLIDRYSFFPNLIPLILTSLTDECEDVVKEAKSFWAKAGNQFVRENEKDYKMRMDYEPLGLEHYPSEVKRPELGCRILVEREMSKFIVVIGKELTDWVATIKIKAAQLLSQVTLHAEQNMTMQLDKIIGPMSKAVMDKELPVVVKYVRLAAYYMGFFVPPKVYCDLIVEYMKEANHGERKVVASIISGSKREELKEHLPKVASLLSGATFKGKDQEALLELVSAVFGTCHEDSLDIGDDIFNALISVIGLAEGTAISQKGSELLEQFVNFSGGNKRETYNKYCDVLLKNLMEAVWTVHCHEQFIFYAFVTESGEVILDNLTDIFIVIKDALSEKSDAEVKLKIYMAINEVIKNHEITLPDNEIKNQFSKVMLEEILPLHLKWYPGRSAEAIRTISCTSLYLILSTFYLEFPIPSSLIPLLLGIIDDPAEKTRTLGLLCIIAISNNSYLHEEETFVNLISNVLKRFDDCERRIRELSVKAVQKLYEAHLVQNENNYINKAVLEFAYDTLLIHLDDAEKNFREKVFVCLDSIGGIQPEKLREKLLDQNFRDKDILLKLKLSVEEKLLLKKDGNINVGNKKAISYKVVNGNEDGRMVFQELGKNLEKELKEKCNVFGKKLENNDSTKENDKSSVEKENVLKNNENIEEFDENLGLTEEEVALIKEKVFPLLLNDDSSTVGDEQDLKQKEAGKDKDQEDSGIKIETGQGDS